MVKRYCLAPDTLMGVAEYPDGDYVRSSDYETLFARCDARGERIELQEARIRALEADNAEALRQLEIARERIQHLNAGIYIVHTMRLNWGLSCPCKCHECDILFEGIRDHLPEGSELETSAQREGKST